MIRVLTLQQKYLFSKELPVCLYIKQPPSPLLEVKIGDHNKEQGSKEEEQSQEADKEDEIKHDWQVAAAVFDRLCAIAFTSIFIGGNLIFVTLFIAHP